MILGSCSLVLLSHVAVWPAIVTHDLLSHVARPSHIWGRSLVFTSASLLSSWFPGSIVGAGSRLDCKRERDPFHRCWFHSALCCSLLCARAVSSRPCCASRRRCASRRKPLTSSSSSALMAEAACSRCANWSCASGV